MKPFWFAAAVAGFAMTATQAPAFAQAARPAPAAEAATAPLIQDVQYRPHGYAHRGYARHGGYYRGGRYYGGGGYYNNGGNVAGAAIAGGILGLATGAIIAGSAANAAPPPPAGGADPNWVAYCARKYQSFDPASGTYLAYDGNRYVCQ